MAAVGGMVFLVATTVQPPVPPTSPPYPTPILTNAAWIPVTRDSGGVIMALVPAGCFMMGSDTGETDEQPVHRQCFEQPFWIDQTEVTQAQFARWGGVQARPHTFVGAQHPVENSSWFEAHTFCELRGARLPTESEWEYAARGPDSLAYPWGNTWVSGYAVWSGNAGDQTAPVGTHPQGASWVGALDLGGNVLEWVSSLYHPYPYDAADGRENSQQRTDYRVLRGGSWEFSAQFLRAANRSWYTPVGNDLFASFRCAAS